ncbi:60S ribosomal protein L27 [Morus notabilis]|uniref:60S ribosomal protein L27 n=1 Tax=Morus notabilis TaxID=981085 RepID=W9SDE3_9ROSA|nr:60S ribosomal protein L27 [Morus notabilis]
MVKKSHMKAFVKLVNYQHLMPTRYTLDVDLKDVVISTGYVFTLAGGAMSWISKLQSVIALSTTEICQHSTLQSKDKVTALKETKKCLEERFKTDKNMWFFTKLSFHFKHKNPIIINTTKSSNSNSIPQKHTCIQAIQSELSKTLRLESPFFKPKAQSEHPLESDQNEDVTERFMTWVARGRKGANVSWGCSDAWVRTRMRTNDGEGGRVWVAQGRGRRALLPDRTHRGQIHCGASTSVRFRWLQRGTTRRPHKDRHRCITVASKVSTIVAPSLTAILLHHLCETKDLPYNGDL